MNGKEFIALAGNLLRDLPPALPNEDVHVLLDTPVLRIERIVSRGQASPEGFWYDQPLAEWVLLVQGSAVLRFEGAEPRALEAGSYIHIAPHGRHRVERTSFDPPAVWLAVHYRT